MSRMTDDAEARCPAAAARIRAHAIRAAIATNPGQENT